MTIKDCINDLESVIEFFKEENDGCFPLCLEEAINLLVAYDKLLSQVETKH